MKGIIVKNAYKVKDILDYNPTRLKQEFEKLGVEVDIKEGGFYPSTVNHGDNFISCEDYDFCVYLDKDKYLLKSMEIAKLPVFNGYDAIMTCDDKMLTHYALSNHGIKMPKTLPGRLCYSKDTPTDMDFVEFVESEFVYPFIMKQCYGSFGNSVYLINNRTEFIDMYEEIKCKPFLVQEYITTSYGTDVRVIVVGGKVLGAMQRYSDYDFRSNIGQGGHGKPYELTLEIIKIAEKVAEILSLDYCGIDLLFGESGEMVLCEVNSNAVFETFEKVTGINVAKAYALHVLNKVKKNI